MADPLQGGGSAASGHPLAEGKPVIASPAHRLGQLRISNAADDDDGGLSPLGSDFSDGPESVLGGGSAARQPLQFGAELDSLTAVVDALDRDAAEESRINQQMAAAVLGRLQSGRAAAERTLAVLQAFAAAEAAYSRAMSAVAKLSLSSEADGPSLRAAMARASDLPDMMGLAHSSVAERLQEAIKGLHTLVGELRTACEEIVAGAGRAKREVDSSRLGLKTALRAHQQACQVLEQVAAQRQRQGGRGRGVDGDPWLTEGTLVEQQVRLQRAQQTERRYLAAAFTRVGDLERRRAAGQAQVLAAFVHIYRAELVPIQEIADELQGLLSEIDAEADLEAFTQVAASSVHSAEALSARQREAVDQICSELLGSAEIVRQGTMERWDSSCSRWQRGHLVLTRAGHLHFFSLDSAAAKAAAASGFAGSGGGESGRSSPGPGGATAPGGGSGGGGSQSRSSSAGQLSWGGASSWTPPVESLNLARCSFEQGEAPVFRIIEAVPGGLATLGGLLSAAVGGGRGRTQTLRAGGIEECMDWAIGIREAIAACSE
ncbi:hypothetical protein COHA_000673 [Chlorella ohadii]|uniref:PH domain-containing protein n=1 Tax=Chlorella ohadii TaxID=2649997 RepID=A0AAD5E2R4_9CHLO|nr:hypothetical protein COHA_000673 [Chlorella ohadii]